ncbi:MAG: hypothetical protein HY981_03535 [Candidatus Magasanikbacteria bacterium]|nr:hypothetical protein [Candidatus Magasanikbacteria bacterium]
MSWRAVLPIVAGYLTSCERAHDVSHDVFLYEMLADAIDLADPANCIQLGIHLINFDESLYGEQRASTAVYLFDTTVRTIARVRDMSMFVKASLNLTLRVYIDEIRVSPLPHGWIFQLYNRQTRKFDRALVVGDCVGDIHDNHPHRTLISDRLETMHVLYALLESWRLDHGHARRYLCDLLRGAFKQEADSTALDAPSA